MKRTLEPLVKPLWQRVSAAVRPVTSASNPSATSRQLRLSFERVSFGLQTLLLALTVQFAVAIEAPTGLVSRTGDRSVVLHWDKNSEPNLSGYRVYRSLSSGGPFVAQNPSLLTSPGFCDLSVGVVNGQTNFYQVTAVTTTAQESLPSTTLAAVPHAFASDDEFLEYVQACNFDYFWYLANPGNGLVPDRSTTDLAVQYRGGGIWADGDRHRH